MNFLKKMATLLRPGGSVILQFTDTYHFVGRLSRSVGRLKEIFAPPRSPVNVISRAEVGALFDRHGFRLVSLFRYAIPQVPGIHKLASQGILYKTVRLIYGAVNRNRNLWLGNEYICYLTASPGSGSSREFA